MFPFATTGGGNTPLFTIGYIILIGALFYFLLMRPTKKQNKARNEMMEKLSVGDEIYTNGGILGTVTRIKERTIWLKISEKCEIELLKDAISGVINNKKEIE